MTSKAKPKYAYLRGDDSRGYDSLLLDSQHDGRLTRHMLRVLREAGPRS